MVNMRMMMVKDMGLMMAVKRVGYIIYVDDKHGFGDSDRDD